MNHFRHRIHTILLVLFMLVFASACSESSSSSSPDVTEENQQDTSLEADASTPEPDVSECVPNCEGQDCGDDG